MPDATITSTASTFGTISGTFAADQSTIVGTVTGIVAGTLDGSVGVPGPQGQQGIQGPPGPEGPPGVGGTWGSILGDITTQVDLWGQLQSKAPIDSPVFTGDARAVTPAFGDNDTSISTTAFVQSALAGGTAVAKNLEVFVRNQSGSTIPAGSIVYISGATGNKPLITLAQANNDANSAQTMGFVKTAIADNGTGYVIVRGELENIDTSGLTEGVQLYLSPTTPGAYTTTKPSAPQHLVYVGIVVRAHPTQGVILVAVQNGYELDELHDVAIASKANNNLLAYESSTNLWKNKTYSALGLLTSADAASTYYPQSNPAGYITSSALTGYALESWVTAGFAPLARGLPASGTVGQVLTKNSGTDYDASWATLIPGDRYLTSSTSSVTIGLGSKTLTVGTGLSYSSQQDVVISFDASNHMHALVTSYNSGTGVLVVNVQSFSGSGTYAAWTVNVGGTTPLQSVEWGEILGVLGDQSDLAAALNSKLNTSTAASTYAPLAGATFTGLVVTPASTTGTAGLRLPHGSAPTTPTNGDLWTTTTGLVGRFNGFTRTMAQREGSNTFSAGAKQTFTSSSTTAGSNLAPIATDPSTLANGDIWVNSTSNDLKVRLNGVSETVAEQSWVNAQGFLTSSALSPYLTISSAASTYYPLTNPAGYIGEAPIDGSQYARKDGAWEVVSIPPDYITSVEPPFSVNSGSLAIDLSAYATVSFVTSQGYITSAALADYLTTVDAAATYLSIVDAATAYQPISGMSSYLTTSAAASSYYPLTGNPSAFVTSASLSGYALLSGATFTGKVNTVASATGGAGLNVPHGSAPTSPVNGDIWTTTSGLLARINGATRQYVDFDGTQTINGNKTFSNANLTLGNSTALGTINLATGATVSGSTKTVNIGTGGAAGSFTNIAIGSTTGTSTTTLQGSTLGVTLAADTNTTALATTAYVVGQAGSAAPVVNGTAAAGTSLRYARQDHVHPTDTSRAALASPTFTGVPAAPTAAVDTNTTQLATTAFVLAQAAAATPLVDGTAAVGTSLRYARADHVHPTDTTRLATANNLSELTATASTARTNLGLSALATASFATDVQARAFTSTTTAINPRQLMWAMLAQDIVYINRQQLSVTNVGTITFTNIGSIGLHTRPGNAGACSSRARILGASNVDQQHNQEVKANPISATNFSLRKIFSGRSRVEIITDTNFTWAWYHGKAEADGVGDLTRRGFGWKMIGGAGSRFLLLQVHNGTTLTSVTSSYAVTANIAFDWDVESDGAGNVTLYVNGTSVATSSAGPTGLVSQTSAIWQEEMQAAAALASPFNDTAHSRGRYIIINP
jgi:hypothetical protein